MELEHQKREPKWSNIKNTLESNGQSQVQLAPDSSRAHATPLARHRVEDPVLETGSTLALGDSRGIKHNRSDQDSDLESGLAQPSSKCSRLKLQHITGLYSIQSRKTC
jgi:hypothetical protein